MFAEPAGAPRFGYPEPVHMRVLVLEFFSASPASLDPPNGLTHHTSRSNCDKKHWPETVGKLHSEYLNHSVLLTLY